MSIPFNARRTSSPPRIVEGVEFCSYSVGQHGFALFNSDGSIQVAKTHGQLGYTASVGSDILGHNFRNETIACLAAVRHHHIKSEKPK